jgi:hypothetical protein
MSTSDSFEALRRANPRARVGFPGSVDAAAEAVYRRIQQEPVDGPAVRSRAARPRRRLVGVSAAGASLVAAAAVAAFFTVGSSGGPGVENAAAAVKKAAILTRASAELSGTATVRMTHDGRPWALKTVRWNGEDVAISDNSPGRSGKTGSGLLVVDGVLYGNDPEDGGWIEFGSPGSIDPDSGTTPGEYLAAVREDIGGPALRRITGGMTGLTTAEAADGSTVYSGTVRSGLIARETGFKEGQSIRVLPFGYVAHDQAADAAAPLDVAVTVGADGIVREIAVTWGTWTYTVTYSGLGSTPAPVAPANAKSLRELRSLGR